MKQEINYTATELYGGAPEWDTVTVIEPSEAAPVADVYQAFMAADAAWSTELERLFGRRAGDVRYTEEGRTGPTLAPLHAEFARARDAWCVKKIPAPTAAPDTTAPTAAHDLGGAELAPLSPVDALRYAITHGVFACETKALLLASLNAADEAELMRAEQLAAARASVAINLEMRKIEAEVFDLPF